MTDHAKLVSAVLDNLDDDAPRLIYADWLEEHVDTFPAGQREAVRARAELIRVQCEAAREYDGSRKSPLETREQELLRRHGAAWADLLGQHCSYARGFPSGVSCRLDTFADTASILEREPAELELRIKDADHAEEEAGLDARIEVLRDDPRLRAVRWITCDRGYHGKHPSAAGVARLFTSPHLANLREVLLHIQPCGLEGIQGLVGSPWRLRLRSLVLYEALQQGEDTEETEEVIEAVTALAASEQLASLRRLELSFNGVGEESVRALLESTTLPADLELEINEPDLGPSLPIIQRLMKRYRVSIS